MRISDWSSDLCSADLVDRPGKAAAQDHPEPVAASVLGLRPDADGGDRRLAFWLVPPEIALRAGSVGLSWLDRGLCEEAGQGGAAAQREAIAVAERDSGNRGCGDRDRGDREAVLTT